MELGPSAIKVEAEGRVLLGGRLWREIMAEDSTWTVSEGVLELSLLKRNRRGNYQDGKTNAGAGTGCGGRVQGSGRAYPALP